MKNVFIQYFSRYAEFTQEEKRAIEENMTIKNFVKGDYLQKEGQSTIDTYFILKGCVREFILRDGEEKTTNFFTEEQWIISLSNFNSSIHSEINLVCVEDTSVCIGNEEQAQKLFKSFPRFETISRAIVEAEFAEQKKLHNSFLTDSPEERYLKLVASRPGILQRVPQYHIASFIGVKPESLSRIRKRILKDR